MNGFWELLTRPALDALAARAPVGVREIVEIGSEGGRNTRHLLDWCSSRGARLHVIEPEPVYDPETLARDFPDSFVFHHATSLEILPKLGRIDAALIDGDHNWYTVYHELVELEKVNGAEFPLVLLHDMAWPFARRDLYYAPARIPGEYRHAYQRGGVRRGEEALAAYDGLAHELNKALAEGGPRNGVRTAVEDFMAQSALALRLEIVPVDFGLGLLATQSLLERAPALRALFDQLSSPAFEHRLLEYLEGRRIDDIIDLQGTCARSRLELEGVVEDLGRHHAELERHQVEVKRLREMLDASTLEVRDLRMRLRSLPWWSLWRIGAPLLRAVRRWGPRA